MHFPVADIDLNPLIPVLIGLAVSVISSPTGLSGGFLILPICVSLLNFDGLAVSPTNFLFIILASPSGLWRLHREKRLMPGLGLILMPGSLFGIFAGTVLRCTWLRAAADFRVFMALVLAGLALYLARNLRAAGDARAARAERSFRDSQAEPANLVCSYQGGRLGFTFGGQDFAVSIPGLFLASLLVGLVGGIYGIGGASLIAPLLLTVFRLPIYLVNGAALLASCCGAVFGLFSYEVFWPAISGQPAVSPDLGLGLLFGLGGALGVYIGSSLQRFLPPQPLKIMMLILVSAMAAQNMFQL